MTPKAVPTELYSTKQGIAPKMAVQQIEMHRDKVVQKIAMTMQYRQVGVWVQGSRQRAIIPAKYRKELATQVDRLVVGHLLMIRLKMILKRVRQENGMMRRVPASVQGMLNLFTSRSLRLSLKEPKLTSVKNVLAIRIQKIDENDLSYRILNPYYAFYSVQTLSSNAASDSSKLSLSLTFLAIQFLKRIHPETMHEKATATPIYQGYTIFPVASQTLVVTTELMASNRKGRLSATEITISKLSLQYLVIISP